MLKRLSALLLALTWALTLTACGAPAASAPTETLPALPVWDEPTAPVETAPPETDLSETAAPTPETNPIETGAPETAPMETAAPATPEPTPTVTEDGWYSTKEDVALYIHLYGHLPENYVTKREAQDAGWSGGSVELYTGEGTAIGGSRFGNYEGLLPEAPGRTYTECDIDTVGASSRGAKRVVFSNDGLIYYTGDHYESFELLYGEP